MVFQFTNSISSPMSALLPLPLPAATPATLPPRRRVTTSGAGINGGRGVNSPWPKGPLVLLALSSVRRRLGSSRKAVPLELENQVKLKVIMLQRGDTAESDVMLGEVRNPDEDTWKPVRLKPSEDKTSWSDADSSVVLQMSEGQLLATLCPQRETSPSFRASAPCWPQIISQQMGPWPLKGPGTVLFEPTRLLNMARELRNGKGPVVIPGGAQELQLPSSDVVDLLFPCLMGSSLADVFGEDSQGQLTYQELLESCPGLGGVGAADLSRVERLTDGRVVTLEQKPFNMECMSRRWSRGAVIRKLGKNGVAETAGCKAGDIIVTINGQAVLNATLAEVEELLEQLPAQLEVGQPVLQEPLYLREATTDLLTTLADVEATEAVEELLPRVSELMEGQASMSDELPQVFAGDGGSASHVHVDSTPMVQMCHVVHGVKIFGVDSSAGATGDLKPWVTRWGSPASTEAEVALPVDVDLDQEYAAWLASRETSIAMCRAGDVMLFWGGNPHFGSNGMGAGPCVALFHGFELSPENA
eukprot:s143_g23.t1